MECHKGLVHAAHLEISSCQPSIFKEIIFAVGFMTPSGPPRSTLFCNGYLVGRTTHGGWLGIRGEVWRSTPGEEGDSTLSRVLVFWVVVSNMFYFHPFLGKIPILTNIFQVGWNHQVGFVWIYPRDSWQNLGEFWGSEDIFLGKKHSQTLRHFQAGVF